MGVFSPPITMPSALRHAPAASWGAVDGWLTEEEKTRACFDDDSVHYTGTT